MNLAQALSSIGGSGAISQVAKQFDLPPQLTSQAIGMMLPSLSQGAQRNAQKESGLGSLIEALTSGSHESYLAEPSKLAATETSADGNKILGHLLGGKDASRGVAATIAGSLGIENDTVKKMLPVVATMAMGALANQVKGKGLKAESKSDPSVLGQLTQMLDVKDAGAVLGALFS